MISLKYRYQLFPFEIIPPNSKIIIWGMGRVGRTYIQQVVESNYCSIVCAVDKNAGAIMSPPIPVFTPERIKTEHFDYVVISVGNKAIMDEIRNILISWGIKEEKIVGRELSLVEESIVENELFSCIQIEAVKSLKEKLRIYGLPVGKRLIRIGNTNDGGYVMLDDFGGRSNAYSFGIDGDVSWDEAIADRGIDVYMYDHTIASLDKTRNEFHFFRQGISGHKHEEMLDTLDSFIRKNNHQNERHMILKMDVEGAEWSFLETVDEKTLLQFDQIVIEMHNLLDMSNQEKILSGLDKINRTHSVIHVHANNWSTVVYSNKSIYPDTLEVTYANRETYNLQLNMDAYLPIDIDAPCCQYIPEIELGMWNSE